MHQPGRTLRAGGCCSGSAVLVGLSKLRSLRWPHSSKVGRSGTQPDCNPPANEVVYTHRSTTVHYRPRLVSFCCVLLMVTENLAAQPDAVKADEATLKAAGVGTDDAALIE